jgi:kinesin family protein 5
MSCKEIAERVHVHVRVRPQVATEIEKEQNESCIESLDTSNSIIGIRRNFDLKKFTFDSLFDYESSQDYIYETIGSPVVKVFTRQCVLEGYNGTILAYGQTGTGKTYTMIGGENEDRGIIPRALEEIFQHVEADTQFCYDVQIGFVQIYMEMLQDLLNVDVENSYVRIRENPGQGVFLSNLSWWPVNNAERCMELLYRGDSNRNTAFTDMNANSSRSHAIYMVKLEKRKRYSQEEIERFEREGKGFDKGMISSTLYLVDLAGSERCKKTKATGIRLDESKTINLALLALGNVISALADRSSKYVPYRDSKLTRILEDSLGGNSKTSLVVTIGPCLSNVSETISSLQFGSRAMRVATRPKINIDVDYKTLCAQLQAELDKVNDNYSIVVIEKQRLMEKVSALEEELEKVMRDRYNLFHSNTSVKMRIAENSTYTEKSGSIDKGVQVKHFENPFENVKRLNRADIDSSLRNDKRNDEAVLTGYSKEIHKMIKEYEDIIVQKEADHQKYLEDLDEHIYKQEEELANIKHQNDILHNQNLELRQELINNNEEFEYQKSKLEARIHQLKIKCENIKQGFQDEIDNLINENESLKDQLANSQTNLENFTDKITELEEVLDSLEKQDSEEIQRLLTEKEDLLLELEATRFRYQQEIEIYRTGLDSSKSSLVELSSCSDSFEVKDRLTKCSTISSAIVYNDKLEKAARLIQRFYRTKKTQIITRKATLAQAVIPM